jgi:hypothetical protein
MINRFRRSESLSMDTKEREHAERTAKRQVRR